MGGSTEAFATGWWGSKYIRVGQFSQWVDRVGQRQRCPRTGYVFGSAGWESQGRWGVSTAMEEAGEHRSGRNGGAASGCQAELANHSNSYVEIRIFCHFFERWKTTTMADLP